MGLLRGLELFDGPYHSGKACFTYLTRRDKRVYQGPFLYHVDSGMPRENVSLKGRFEQDLKDGRWTYCQRLPERKCCLKVDYLQGARNGAYELEVWEKRMHIQVECRLVLTFRHNHPVGPVKALINNYVIEGQCDERGLADGVWTRRKVDKSKDKKIFEERWQHGHLLQSDDRSSETGLSQQPDKDNCLQLIQQFVEEYGQPLERRAAHGHRSWGGTIGQVPT